MTVKNFIIKMSHAFVTSTYLSVSQYHDNVIPLIEGIKVNN